MTERQAIFFTDQTSVLAGIKLLIGRYWEQGLLIGLVALIMGMVVHLLFPQPQAVIQLKPYAHFPSVAAALPAAAISESADLPNASDRAASKEAPREKRHRTHHTSHQKPEHPPITDLNRADLSQLQLLKGIGPKMAQRILDYRRLNGGFKTIEQVMDVKGIGPKKFEKIKPYLKV